MVDFFQMAGACKKSRRRVSKGHEGKKNTAGSQRVTKYRMTCHRLKKQLNKSARARSLDLHINGASSIEWSRSLSPRMGVAAVVAIWRVDTLLERDRRSRKCRQETRDVRVLLPFGQSLTLYGLLGLLWLFFPGLFDVSRAIPRTIFDTPRLICSRSMLQRLTENVFTITLDEGIRIHTRCD
jgi:hypothetical protein